MLPFKPIIATATIHYGPIAVEKYQIKKLIKIKKEKKCK